MAIDISRERQILARVLRESVTNAKQELAETLAPMQERVKAFEHELGALVRQVAKAEIQVDSIAAKLADFEQRLDDLAAWSLADDYLGTWSDDESYCRGALVTDRGSLWICLDDTVSRPGENGAWQLCVKRGRDGRDSGARR